LNQEEVHENANKTATIYAVATEAASRIMDTASWVCSKLIEFPAPTELRIAMCSNGPLAQVEISIHQFKLRTRLNRTVENQLFPVLFCS
jgi:hypothetical protein